MNRETLDQWCERGILGLVLGLLVFGPLAFGAVEGREFLIAQGLVIGVLGLWLVRLWLNPRPKFLWPPVCWVVVAFVGYAIGRYLTCDIEYIGRQELLRVLGYAAVFFAILNNLHRQEYTQIISFTLIFLAVAISGYAILQFATGSEYVWGVPSGYKGRGSGTYISPNHLAGFLEMLVPLALAYTLIGRGKALTKIFIGYAALVMIAGIAVTASRGSWIATILALAFFCAVLLAHRDFRLPALALLVVLVGSGAFFVTRTQFFKARFSNSIQGGRVDLDRRYDMWDAAARMWRDHFWVGVGPGHYDFRFREYRPPSLQMRPERAHNDYLNALADWGIIGTTTILLALGMVAYGVAGVWRNVRRGERDLGLNLSNKFAFVIGASAGLLALTVHSVVDFNLHIPANAILAVSLMALLTSHWRFATERFWFGAGWPVKLAASFALVAAAGYLSYQEVRLAREWTTLRPAAAPELESLEQAAILERAFAIEPRNFETAYQIGEAYRRETFTGEGDYETHAAKAIEWYQRGITNNPFHAYNYMRWGMVLDFLGDHTAAEPLFLEANRLDPNGYFVTAHVGKHFVDAGEYAAARPWLERSLMLYRTNEIAAIHLQLANERLLEAATNQFSRSLLDKFR